MDLMLSTEREHSLKVCEQQQDVHTTRMEYVCALENSSCI